MTERDETGKARWESIGGSLTFGLPQAIIVAIVSIVIAIAVAIANS
jgi:hypothetical protein